MTPAGLRRFAWAAAFVLAGAALAWYSGVSRSDNEAAAGPAGQISIAVTGDSFVVRPWPEPGRDAGLDAVAAILARATVAITNLEEVLTERAGDQDRGWPVGPAQVAMDLRRLGITVVTRANNHSADRGPDGLRLTGDILDGASIRHTGAGTDLERARTPAFVGARPARVAVISITTSASDEARATKSRGEIRGRPGVNRLRYTVEITADPPTYQALAAVAKSTGAEGVTDGSFRMSGRLIKKGGRTAVDLVADESDRDELLDAIAAARTQADVVIVALHSHEPGNLSQTPALFVQDFAHRAIDRGAAAVVMSGPRQLRGIEVYRGAPIFYSLGNFAFDAASLPLESADAFDANTNLADVALGQTPPPEIPRYDEPVWWESVVATITFEQGRAVRINFDPIDLGTALPLAERGRPRLADKERGAAILQRLAALSQRLGGKIELADGTAELRIRD